MNRFAVGVFLAIAWCAAVTSAAMARETALATVAAQLGYSYTYLGPEDAVELKRPNLVVLVRPGERLFDVNDRTEAMDGPPPRFSHDDLYVADPFVGRLRQLAARYPLVLPSEHAVTVVNSSATVSAPTAGTGSISSLEAHQIPGTQELSVSGKAPANLPITLTLIGTFSSEIPDVVLSRSRLSSDADGSFTARVSIAPGYLRGAYLTLVASSVPGVTSATYRLQAKAPNGDVSLPAEEPQRSVR